MKIRSKLYISAGVSGILTVSLVLGSLHSARAVRQNEERNQLVSAIKQDIHDLNIILLEYLMYHEPRMEQQWFEEYNATAANLERPELVGLPQTVQSQFKALRPVFASLVKNYDVLTDLRKRSAPAKRIAMVTDIEDRLTTRALIVSHAITTSMNHYAGTVNADRATIQLHSQYFITILAVAFSLGAAMTAILIIRSISAPLSVLVEATERVGSGDLDTTFATCNPDEIGELGKAFEQMTLDLKQITASRDELNREILHRQAVEAELRKHATAQKSLLREVNHRVKNNLVTIVSLLHREQDRLPQTDPSPYAELLNQLINRMQGLSAVHSLLSASLWQPVPVTSLCQDIVKSAVQAGKHLDQSIDISIGTSDLLIDSEEAHHLALVINELTINTLKYARQNDKQLAITVVVEQSDGDILLTYRDNGPGYPTDLLADPEGCGSIGLELIHGIVGHTLSGSVSLSNQPGATAAIRIRHNPICKLAPICADTDVPPAPLS